MPLTSLTLGYAKQVRDLSPLRGMSTLENLFIAYADSLTDLTPLQGMRLVTLHLKNCSSVSDLSPLQGMPLTTLAVTGNPKSSLTDLSPLAGMKLKSIDLGNNSGVLKNRNSMKVLREMPSLISIKLRAGGVLSAEDFWKKFDAGEIR
jgi:internalin A